MSGVSHVAGDPAEMLQSCVRCGVVLLDYRRVRAVSPSFKPRWWSVGGQVAVTAEPRTMRSAEGGEVPCIDAGGEDEDGRLD